MCFAALLRIHMGIITMLYLDSREDVIESRQ